MGNRLSQLGGGGAGGAVCPPDDESSEVAVSEAAATAAGCSSTLSLVVVGVEDFDNVSDEGEAEGGGGLHNLGFATSVKDVRTTTTTTHPPPPPMPTRGSLSSTSSFGSGTTPNSSSRPRICPILQNGRQVTKDFYWVLPERRGRLERQRSLQEASQATSATVGQVNDDDNGGEVYQNMQPVEPSPTQLMPRRSCRSESGGGGGGGAVVRLVARIRRDVPGVTAEECRLALSLHGWDSERASRYLRVEQLFRLGLADRRACLEVLEASGWSVEAAGAALVDRMAWSD